MEYKSKYTKEEVQEQLEYLKSNVGEDTRVTFTTGIKYNIWMVINGEIDLEYNCWILNLLQPDDQFIGTVFGKKQSIFMWLPEFE